LSLVARHWIDMPQPLIFTLLLFALVLPILGAVGLRVLAPRLTPAQFYGAAALIGGVVIASVLVLSRGDIPNLQIGRLSILLPITAPEDSDLVLVPTPTGQESTIEPAAPATAPATVAPTAALTPAPTVVATATLTPTVLPPTAEPTQAPTATLEPTAIPPTAAPAQQRTYTVQPGDTLVSIAEEFNTTVRAIVDANGLTPEQADALRIGQELVIP
jgi:LysM repeat protein